MYIYTYIHFIYLNGQYILNMHLYIHIYLMKKWHFKDQKSNEYA